MMFLTTTKLSVHVRVTNEVFLVKNGARILLSLFQKAHFCCLAEPISSMQFRLCTLTIACTLIKRLRSRSEVGMTALELFLNY